MSLFKKKTPTNELLSTHSIPRPESLMVSMLALKISKLPADEDYLKGFLRLEYPMGKGNDMEVKFEYDHSYMGAGRTVSIGITGKPSYRSIILTTEERQILIDQWTALIERSRALRDIRLEHESQDAALNAIEHLLSPVDFDTKDEE